MLKRYNRFEDTLQKCCEPVCMFLSVLLHWLCFIVCDYWAIFFPVKSNAAIVWTKLVRMMEGGDMSEQTNMTLTYCCYSTWAMPEIFLVLLEILGFIVSSNLSYLFI